MDLNGVYGQDAMAPYWDESRTPSREDTLGLVDVPVAVRPQLREEALDLARDLLWVDPPVVIWAGKSHHLSTWDPVDFHHTDLQSA